MPITGLYTTNGGTIELDETLFDEKMITDQIQTGIINKNEGRAVIVIPAHGDKEKYLKALRLRELKLATLGLPAPGALTDYDEKNQLFYYALSGKGSTTDPLFARYLDGMATFDDKASLAKFIYELTRLSLVAMKKDFFFDKSFFDHLYVKQDGLIAFDDGLLLKEEGEIDPKKSFENYRSAIVALMAASKSFRLESPINEKLDLSDYLDKFRIASDFHDLYCAGFYLYNNVKGILDVNSSLDHILLKTGGGYRYEIYDNMQMLADAIPSSSKHHGEWVFRIVKSVDKGGKEAYYLENLRKEPLNAITSKGDPKAVPPGGKIPLKVGIKINVYGCDFEIASE
ncbi:MAG: hypothetical protein K5694_00025 [Bacilli bacterium]|nr:hypothetical protein [Bacilli bacterium]